MGGGEEGVVMLEATTLELLPDAEGERAAVADDVDVERVGTGSVKKVEESVEARAIWRLSGDRRGAR